MSASLAGGKLRSSSPDGAMVGFSPLLPSTQQPGTTAVHQLQDKGRFMQLRLQGPADRRQRRRVAALAAKTAFTLAAPWPRPAHAWPWGKHREGTGKNWARLQHGAGPISRRPPSGPISNGQISHFFLVEGLAVVSSSPAHVFDEVHKRCLAAAGYAFRRRSTASLDA